MTISDILLRRTVQGTTADLFLDMLVLPTGEGQIFRQQDIRAADVADAFVASEPERSTEMLQASMPRSARFAHSCPQSLKPIWTS